MKQPLAVPSEIFDRMPPHDLDAEKAVLGAVLIRPSILDELTLRPEDFYVEMYRRILPRNGWRSGPTQLP